MKKILITFTAVCFLATGIARSQEERFEAVLEKKRVSVGNPLYLYLTFHGGQNVERPEISFPDGLQVKYVGPATKMSVINGRVSQSITHTYLIIPLKKGEFKIGPFFTKYEGQTYRADAVTLIATDLPSQPVTSGSSAPPSVRGEPQEAAPYVGDRIFLTMEIGKTLVYINEVVPVTIKVYVNALGLRDIEYPTYSHEGFSSEEFAEPERHREIVRGVEYDVLVFRQNLFAIKEGNYVLGPAKLHCKLVVRKKTSRRTSFFGTSIFDDDFFASRFGYQTYPIELESEEVPVTILPFPAEERPSDFQGAVGYFDLDVKVTPSEVKVGDPVVLRMVISGRGNLDTVTAPRLMTTDNFKTYEPQVTKKGGEKIYEQILIPKTDKVKEIPEVSFSFFNPSTGKYKTIRKGPFPLKVVSQPESERVIKMVSMPGAEQIFYPQEKIGKDIIYIKENLGKLYHQGYFLYRNWLFWAGQAVPILLFLTFYFSYRKKERMLKDKGYARFLKAPGKARNGLARAKAYLGSNDMLPFYDVIFKTLQEYLGDRFNLPIGSVTGKVIEDRLRQAGCDEKILKVLRDVFRRCEMARYASSVPGGHEAKETLKEVRKIIECVERLK